MADLLQAVPPEDYFKHKDLRPVVLESVKRDDRPYLALVGAPGTWDVSAHPSLPLFGIYKTNDKDNADMPAPSHWRLVFTAPGREELAVLPWEESDKLPPAQPAAATPPPPGTRPKTTYSFDQRWRDVPYAALPAEPKEWRVVLHAGDFLSNAITVRIAGAKAEAARPNGAIRAPKPAASYAEAERHLYVRHAGHPEIPQAGVAFAKPVAGGTPEKPSLMLWGAFQLPDPPRPEAENLRLHLLFSAPDIPGGMSRTVPVPVVFAEIRENRIQGRFGLDLAPLFRGPSGRIEVPAHLYVTPVRGSFIGQPWEIVGEGGWHP
jgi:hypothetical protein